MFQSSWAFHKPSYQGGLGGCVLHLEELCVGSARGLCLYALWRHTPTKTQAIPECNVIRLHLLKKYLMSILSNQNLSRHQANQRHKNCLSFIPGFLFQNENTSSNKVTQKYLNQSECFKTVMSQKTLIP